MDFAIIARIILSLCALFMIIAAGLPFIRLQWWWIRSADFPRLQAGLIGLAVLGANFFVWQPQSVWQNVLLGLLTVATVFQFSRVAPYTRLYSKQVLDYNAEKNRKQISLLVANVQLENRESDPLMREIATLLPDMILAVETDDWWCNQLSPLDAEYPYSEKVSRDTGYGMVLLSRLKLDKVEVRFLTREEVPSIRAQVLVDDDLQFVFYGVHPPPPFPDSALNSTPRDAELILVAREVAQLDDQPVVVLGDLNDVAWSHTTGLFQRISRLLDPRVGRGLYSTFHAKLWYARWPLDHVFHSNHFKLVEMKTLPAIGSDHFPVYIKLSFEPEDRYEQDTESADNGDEREADEMVEEERNSPSKLENADNAE